MRARHNFRRDIITAIVYLIGATGGTSYAILLNQRPNGVIWFPWIITGWFLIGGAATWFGVILSTHAVVWTRTMTTPPRRMPSRAEVNRPPVRPFTPEQNAAITERMAEDYADGVRAAAERAPEPDLETTADRVREALAPEPRPETQTATWDGIDPVTGRLFVDGKPVMPAAVQRVIVPRNPSPGIVDALVRAHGGTSRGHTFTVGTAGPNPAVTITEADV